MFRKLVSSLPYSPALVGQLGFYARRLSKEQATRRLGLIFTVLALAVQSFTIFSPPEPTYAASPTNACPYNASILKTDSDCKSCPFNTTLWAKDADCKPAINRTLSAVNLSQSGKDASKTVANAGDRIQYTLRTTNAGSSKSTVVVQQSLSDILEYATVIDAGGGTFDPSAKLISWGAVALTAKQADTRSFVIQVNDNLANTPQAVDNTSSYDCTITGIYGTKLNIALSCPLGKQVESTVRQLPRADTGVNITFAAIVLALVVYLYARARAMNREIKIIRHDYNVG